MRGGVAHADGAPPLRRVVASAGARGPRWFATAVGLFAALTVALPLAAQRRGDAVRVRSGTALRALPGGEVVGVSSREIAGEVESVQYGAVRIAIVGWVPGDRVTLRGDRARGTVSGASGATVRATAAASGDAIAELRRGTFVFPDGRQTFAAPRDGWLAVRRAIWVDTSRIRTAPSRVARAETRGGDVRATAASGARADTAVPAPAPAPAEPAAAPPEGRPPLEAATTVTLHAGPTGAPIGSVVAGTGFTPLARENGWVRVRLEGWVPDSSAVAAGTRRESTLAAADLRADPEGTRGRVVRWTVEALAFQRADGLRRGLAEGEAYLLARGPGAERAMLYLAVPDSLLAQAQGLPPLTSLAVTARVREGRSQPAGVPVLELLGLTRR